MKVIKCEPMKKAYVKEVDNAPWALNNEVGGHAETFYPFDDNAVIVCNDEGKVNGMKPCRGIRSDDGELFDIICGEFLICNKTQKGFESLSDDSVNKYLKMFELPERMITTESGTEMEKIYTATDGAEFDTERKCMQYEDEQISKEYDSLRHHNFCSPTDNDYWYEMTLLKDEADFKTLVAHWDSQDMETDCLYEPSSYPCMYTVYVEYSAVYTFDTNRAIKDLYDTARAMEDFVKNVFKGESNENQ